VRMPSSVFAPYTPITTNILFFENKGKTEETWFYRLDMPQGYKHFSKTNPMKLEHFQEVEAWWNNRVEVKDENTDAYKAKKYTAEEIVSNGYNIDLCGYPTEEKEILSPEETMANFIARREELDREMDAKLAAIKALLEA